MLLYETSKCYQDAVLAFLEGADDLTKSFPFRRMETSKQRRFAALIPLATHLLKQNLLDFQPFFLFPVISALGYLNEDAEKMTQWMYAVMNKTLTGTRDDGVALSTLKARYKVQVRNAICFGLARGNSLAMNAAGRPHVSRAL